MTGKNDVFEVADSAVVEIQSKSLYDRVPDTTPPNPQPHSVERAKKLSDLGLPAPCQKSFCNTNSSNC